MLGLLVAFPGTARAADGDQPASAPSAAPQIVTTSGWYAPDAPADTITTFEPAGPGPYPAVVFVHGGAWGRSQPNAYELDWAKDLAEQQSWLVAVIGYPTKVRNEHVVEPRAISLAM